jgi:hydrogenase maturation protease
MNPVNSARKALLIGYGNDLRGDDCAGRRVAEAIADCDIENIEVRSVHQLTPDLAPLIAVSDLAIFADASAEPLDRDIRVRLLTPTAPAMDGAHSGSAAELLGLSEWLYGKCPEAYAIDIFATDFEFSLTPSPRTGAAIEAAIQCVHDLSSGNLGDY